MKFDAVIFLKKQRIKISIGMEKEERNGVFIDVDLKKMIQKLYISPNSPKWFKDVLRDINLKYEMDVELFQSKVFESLDFAY